MQFCDFVIVLSSTHHIVEKFCHGCSRENKLNFAGENNIILKGSFIFVQEMQINFCVKF